MRASGIVTNLVLGVVRILSLDTKVVTLRVLKGVVHPSSSATGGFSDAVDELLFRNIDDSRVSGVSDSVG